MSAYDRAITLRDDFMLEQAAFYAANKGMQEVTAAIRQRQRADQAAAETRRAELTATVGDQSRPLTVRRLAEAELADLPEYCPQITAAEAAAYEAERTTAETALSDLRKTVAAIKAATKEAKTELDQIRAETAGKAYFDCWQNSMNNNAKEYAELKELHT